MLRDKLKIYSFFRGIANFIRYPKEIMKMVSSKSFVFLCEFEPGHYYSPIPNMAEISKSREQEVIFDEDNKILGVDLNTSKQLELLKEFKSYYPDFSFSVKKTDNDRFWLDNGMYSFGDAAVLFSMLRHFKPAKIVEVGSGFSSALMLDVNQKDFKNGIELTFIEPYANRLHGLLRDSDSGINILESRIQEVDLDRVLDLSENDILFIDSSHVTKKGSDLLYILSEIVPRLNKGVILHFHDIFWPFDYPKEWIKSGRAWNEAYCLKFFLQFNNDFEILFFNSYIKEKHEEELDKYLPVSLEEPSNFPYTQGMSSLWIKKTT